MLIWAVMSAREADCHHTIVNIIADTTLHSVLSTALERSGGQTRPGCVACSI